MNKENIAKKAEAYALKKWGYKEGTSSMDIIYMDTAVVNNSTEDFTAGYTEGHRDASAAAWVSVSERLPEPYIEVLGWLKHKECPGVVSYYSDAWWHEVHDEVSVTHWQPIKPPTPLSKHPPTV